MPMTPIDDILKQWELVLAGQPTGEAPHFPLSPLELHVVLTNIYKLRDENQKLRAHVQALFNEIDRLRHQQASFF